MRKFFIFILSIAPLLPGIVRAAAPTTFAQLLAGFNAIIGDLIPVLMGLALVAFFWGVAKYIFSAGNKDSAEEGKQVIFWGVIALFVLTSIWGILRFLISDFEFGTLGIPQLPIAK